MGGRAWYRRVAAHDRLPKPPRRAGSAPWADTRKVNRALWASVHPYCLVAVKSRWMSVNAGFLTPVIVIRPFWWIGESGHGLPPSQFGRTANSSSVQYSAPESHGLVA